MAAQRKTGLALNIIPITFNTDKITIGRLPSMQRDEYRALRETYWQAHAFRYDSRTDTILNVPIAPDTTPLGESDEVDIQEHLLLIARAIQQNILVWLANRRPILRSNKKLIFWGQTDDALLLSQAINKVGLQKIDGLEVVLRYDIDCRMFRSGDDQHYLGLVIDLATSNIIDIPTSELLKQGFQIAGRYVCRRQETDQDYLRSKLELLGQVSDVDGSNLLLTDTNGITKINTKEAFLEPRLENINDVIRFYYGPQADSVLSALDDYRKPLSTATGKLARIRQTLDGLRKKRPIIISNDVIIELGDLLNPTDDRFPHMVTTTRPILLFGPQGRKRGPYPDPGITEHGPYMYMQHERNEPLIAVICEARYRGRVEQFIKLLRDGYPEEMWENERKPNPFPEGLIGKFRLGRIRIEYEECQSLTAHSYTAAVDRLLNRLPDTPDLSIVQTKQGFLKLYGDDNPYLVSKAAFMMASVPTQSIHIENIDIPGDGLAYLLNNISVAIYAKLDGTPWVISTRGPTTHEIVIGLGSAEVGRSRTGGKTRYVGITSVFQGDGRYLVWGLTREVEFEYYIGALLASLQTTIAYVQKHNTWQEGDNVRIVCHVYKRMRDCEVEAIKKLVQELTDKKFNVEFAFLDISWWHPYHIFDEDQKKGVDYWDMEKKALRTKGKGVPPRGLCFQLDNSRGLLHLVGPKDVKTETQGLPKPLLIELHRDSDFTDMTYLLRQVYHFTYMSWRTFFPGSEPVTIIYSRLIARLLGNLKTITGWNSQVLSSGSLRNRRWFL